MGSIEIIPRPNWEDKGTFIDSRDTKDVRVPQLQLDNATTYIDKDESNNITFTDAVTGTKTLAQLAAVSGGDMLKSVYDPTDEGAIKLTPRATCSGAEGTLFYDSDDNSVYVATEL